MPRSPTDRTPLQQIIAALPEGVIIVNPDQTIAWANQAALDMHAVLSVSELGGTIAGYQARFELRYRDRQLLSAMSIRCNASSPAKASPTWWWR